MSRQAWFRKLDPRRALSAPAIYSLHSRLVGPDRLKQSYVDTILKARAGERVLDIGCGTGDIIPFLPDVEYVGFDGDAGYIARARTEFGDRGRFEHRLVSANVVEDFEPFDLAIATGILHHLSDAEATALFAAAYSALKPGGRLVTCDGAYSADQNALARWLVSLDRGAHIRSPEAYQQLARSAFRQVELEVRTDLNRIVYTHCVLTCRKEEESE